MNDISIILNAIKKLDPKLKPTAIYSYPKGYFIEAPKTKPGEVDYDDPYYILTGDLKSISKCRITSDTIKTIKQALFSKPIWTKG